MKKQRLQHRAHLIQRPFVQESSLYPPGVAVSWRMQEEKNRWNHVGDHHWPIVEKARKSRTWQWASGHIRSRSEEFMWRVVGGPRKLKKITRFSFSFLLKRKKYFTNPSCVPHWERKTSPQSTALVNRIGLQPFLRTRSYPALVSATAVGADLADFAVRPKARQYTRQVLKRTESLSVPNTSPTQTLGCANAAED